MVDNQTNNPNNQIQSQKITPNAKKINNNPCVNAKKCLSLQCQIKPF